MSFFVYMKEMFISMYIINIDSVENFDFIIILMCWSFL